MQGWRPDRLPELKRQVLMVGADLNIFLNPLPLCGLHGMSILGKVCISDKSVLFSQLLNWEPRLSCFWECCPGLLLILDKVSISLSVRQFMH